MAVRSIAVSQPSTNTKLAVWTGLTFSGLDTGQPWDTFDYADYTVQFGGTFGAGGSVSLEGSNDGTTYFVLNDVQASAITKTAAALEQVAEAPRWVRPVITAGDGTTSLTCTLYARRGR